MDGSLQEPLLSNGGEETGLVDDCFDDYVSMQGLLSSDNTHKGTFDVAGGGHMTGCNGVLPSAESPGLHNASDVCGGSCASLPTQGADDMKCSVDWVGKIGEEERGVANGGVNATNGEGGVTPPIALSACLESSSLHSNGHLDTHVANGSISGSSNGSDLVSGSHSGSEILSKSNVKPVSDRDSWGRGSCGQASELGNSWEQSSDSPASELCPLYEDSASDDYLDSDCFPMESCSASFSSPMPSCRSASFSNVVSSCRSRSSRSVSFSSPVPALSYRSAPYGSATYSDFAPAYRVSVYSLSSAFAILDEQGTYVGVVVRSRSKGGCVHWTSKVGVSTGRVCSMRTCMCTYMHVCTCMCGQLI